MSDPKRGSRDISELKQRLGLKKASPPSAAASHGVTGALPPPPGLNLPPPPPPQPVIPNAAEDPFAAMNAMAAVGTVQRAPEIIIVNDGKPVEHVGASKSGAKIAKIVIPAVAALIVGVGIGQIAKGANLYNAGLKDARSILGDDKAPSTVKYVKRAVSELEGVLDEMKAKNNFRPDAAADKRLTDLAGRLDVKTTAVFRTAGSIDTELSGLVMAFYAGVAEVKGMLDTHQKSAKYDSQLLATAKTKGEEAAVTEGQNAGLASIGAVRYGALMQAPTDAERGVDFGVKIVELGQPYCGGKEPSTTGRCEKESPTGYAYRTDPGAPWRQGDLQTQGTDAVPSKRIVLLLPSGTRDELIKGSGPSASEVFYAKRLATIAERAKKLIEDGNKLEQRLQAESNKSARFSFFL